MKFVAACVSEDGVDPIELEATNAVDALNEMAEIEEPGLWVLGIHVEEEESEDDNG